MQNIAKHGLWCPGVVQHNGYCACLTRKMFHRFDSRDSPLKEDQNKAGRAPPSIQQCTSRKEPSHQQLYKKYNLKIGIKCSGFCSRWAPHRIGYGQNLLKISAPHCFRKFYSNHLSLTFPATLFSIMYTPPSPFLPWAPPLLPPSPLTPFPPRGSASFVQ